LFAVSIGLDREGRTVAGVVHNPVSGFPGAGRIDDRRGYLAKFTRVLAAVGGVRRTGGRRPSTCPMSPAGSAASKAGTCPPEWR
jgi:hypothetical protein